MKTLCSATTQRYPLSSVFSLPVPSIVVWAIAASASIVKSELGRRRLMASTSELTISKFF